MFGLIIICIAFVITWVFFYFFFLKPEGEYIPPRKLRIIIVSSILAFFCSFCLFFVFVMYDAIFTPTEYKTDVISTTKLSAVSSGNGTSGTIAGAATIIYVTVNTNREYEVMTEEEDGGHKKLYFPVEDVTIYEAEEQFRLETVAEFEKKETSKNRFCFFRNFHNRWIFSWRQTGKVFYRLYVPEGSIVNQYKVD